MANPNFGLDAELKAKQDAKYDPALEAEVVGWIEAIVGADKAKGDQPVQEWLKSGQVLCHLINAIKPGTVKKVNTMNAPFKQMENITYFMNGARDFGVPEGSMFGTPDLYEDKNMGSVIQCIYTLGGVVQVECPDFAGPKLGVPVTHVSKDTKRDCGPATQSGGLAVSLDQARPTDGARSRAGLGVPGAAGGSGAARSPSPRPAGASSSPRPAAPAPAAAGSPRPSVEAKPKEDGLYGMDADLKAKQEAGHDQALEEQVIKWVEDIVGAEKAKGDQSMHEWLKSGQVLCHLLNAIKPGTVKKVNTMNAPFKQMENITFFMDGARGIGVPEYAMFGTPDLYEEKNMDSVTKCIFTLGGAVQVHVPEFSGPKLGIPMQDLKDAKREKGKVNMSDGFKGAMDVSQNASASGIVKPS